jgi:hypothetical protein
MEMLKIRTKLSVREFQKSSKEAKNAQVETLEKKNKLKRSIENTPKTVTLLIKSHAF